MSDSDETLSGELATLLHELAVGLFKTRLLLEEADPSEWRSVEARLRTLKQLVNTFPATPRPRRTLGFVVGAGRVANRKRRT